MRTCQVSLLATGTQTAIGLHNSRFTGTWSVHRLAQFTLQLSSVRDASVQSRPDGGISSSLLLPVGTREAFGAKSPRRVQRQDGLSSLHRPATARIESADYTAGAPPRQLEVRSR